MPLRVLIDGSPLVDQDAAALWRRFSAWMDEHPGDLAGFAQSEGFASVHPELHRGDPVLIASRVAPQRSYTNASTPRDRAATGRLRRGPSKSRRK